MYRSSSSKDAKARDSYSLSLGFCQLNFRVLMDMYKNEGLFAVVQGSVPMAAEIMAQIAARRPGADVAETSVLDPGMLFNKPQLFLLGAGSRNKVNHDLWGAIHCMLKQNRGGLGRLIQLACSVIPSKVVDAWERINQVQGVPLALSESQLCGAFADAFIEAMVRLLALYNIIHCVGCVGIYSDASTFSALHGVASAGDTPACALAPGVRGRAQACLAQTHKRQCVQGSHAADLERAGKSVGET